jgi:hypothetical protein
MSSVIIKGGVDRWIPLRALVSGNAGSEAESYASGMDMGSLRRRII